MQQPAILRRMLMILIASLTISCNSEHAQPIEIRHYARKGELKEKLKSILTVKETNDSIKYSYSLDNSGNASLIYMFRRKKGNSSKLSYYDFNLLLDEKRSITLNGEDIELKRFDYDVPNMYDEEESIYYLDNYGVIAIRGNAWSYFLLFDKGGQWEKDIFNYLLQDTTGFFGY